ncbi:MAG: hypothetical protein KAZ87_15005 [Spirochaetes bacterium]|nr:hypothetical protein [Spirochaetota bacterium]
MNCRKNPGKERSGDEMKLEDNRPMESKTCINCNGQIEKDFTAIPYICRKCYYTEWLCLKCRECKYHVEDGYCGTYCKRDAEKILSVLFWRQHSGEFHPYTCKCGKILQPNVISSSATEEISFYLKCNCGYYQKLSEEEIGNIQVLYDSKFFLKERSDGVEITCKLMNFSKSEKAGEEEITIKNCEMNSNNILLIIGDKEYLLETDELKKAVLFCSSGKFVLNKD